MIQQWVARKECRERARCIRRGFELGSRWETQGVEKCETRSHGEVGRGPISTYIFIAGDTFDEELTSNIHPAALCLQLHVWDSQCFMIDSNIFLNHFCCTCVYRFPCQDRYIKQMRLKKEFLWAPRQFMIRPNSDASLCWDPGKQKPGDSTPRILNLKPVSAGKNLLKYNWHNIKLMDSKDGNTDTVIPELLRKSESGGLL